MEGWKCPGCGFCYSPFVKECSNCNQVKTYADTTNTYVDNILCKNCGKSRYDAPSTGCGMFHYGTYGGTIVQ